MTSAPWYSITKAFCIAFVMTFFSAFDVPVFWPILLFYWVVLFSLTMRRQISHMIKYKYVPFSFGKQLEHSEDMMAAEEGCFEVYYGQLDVQLPVEQLFRLWTSWVGK
ncbi:Retrieval of early ER protein Rer1 [Sesbania bispinosa]|nr:Retrieval of early ER protein Rer1 [Sesbania bispinosa]